MGYESDDNPGTFEETRDAQELSNSNDDNFDLVRQINSYQRFLRLITDSESTYKAEDAVDELSEMIRQVLDNHQILAQ